MELGQLCNITEKKLLSKYSTKDVAWKVVPGPFFFLKLTYFDIFAITYPI